jgi:hypothetical protein
MAPSDEEKSKLKRTIAYYKEEVRAELARLEAASSAKEVAGKSIGKHGLIYITLIASLGIIASLYLEEAKIAAVMGLLGSSLTALISMLSNIAGATDKQERPEFAVINQLIEKLDKLDREEQPMRVDVEGGNVTVKRGDDVIRSNSQNKQQKGG